MTERDGELPPVDGQRWINMLTYDEYRWSEARQVWVNQSPDAIPRPGVDPEPVKANLPEGQRDLILE